MWGLIANHLQLPNKTTVSLLDRFSPKPSEYMRGPGHHIPQSEGQHIRVAENITRGLWYMSIGQAM